ncbi:alpha/beta hydrolase [Aestuariivivens insulae]|uniref:alpha/beta hydrolase n=1 Tax=Aestuariivivens insulae TaxID=1621988 RepID=UPI001F596A7C|nr:alpha/beta hydrolase [Aestuariivivens insulae]
MTLATLYVFQEKLLFLSTALDQGYQYRFNHDFEELFLTAQDGAILNAVHFKVKAPKGVILYFHGNAGDLSRWGTMAGPFVEKGYDVLIMDYRTYGKSTGKLSEAVFYTDAQLFYTYLKQDYNERDITVYGRSLGTAMAAFLASKYNPRQLILETPYYSMSDVAAYRFPFFPVKKLLKYKFPSYQYISKVKCPITIFHGTDDEVVPLMSAKKLFQEAPKPQTDFVLIKGGNHNNLMAFEDYQSKVDYILP